ncbi:MAG TPA: arylamine N-acetyltransferase, partial [Vicinamibacterales bacterium]
DPDIDTIAALMRAHMAAIPFENLDVLLGRGIRLDLESVTAKLVTARRGGYCFEHGTLFQAALRALGVAAAAHAARVLLVAPKAEAPRTHMFLTVEDAGTTWVLDPGFGGQGPLVPVPLVEGEEARRGPDLHRLLRRDGEWVLEGLVNGVMAALWTSSLEPQLPVDFTLANHYVATFPESPFATRLMIRALTPDGRVSVMNRDVTVLRDGVAETRQLASRAELRALLERYFGFDLPEVDRLRIPTVPEWA